MLTQELRPKKFSEVVGQSLNVETLKSVVAHPDESPRVFILQGSYGSGKTTLSRIFARALNCEKGKREACLECESCRSVEGLSAFYQEYDCTDVGNKQAIQAIKDSLISKAARVKWRVVVFDESHTISKPAMNSLLKTLEELSHNIFVFFCTTEIDKMLDTVRSRSVELVFNRLPVKEIYAHLQNICANRNISIESDVLGKVAYYSRGHMRDAIMKLDHYIMLDDKSVFEATISSGFMDMVGFFESILSGDKSGVQEWVGRLAEHPLSKLKLDYFDMLNESIKFFVTGNGVKLLEPMVKGYGNKLFDLLKISTSSWAVNTFESDLTLQALLWFIYYQFKPKGNTQVQGGLLARAMKR